MRKSLILECFEVPVYSKPSYNKDDLKNPAYNNTKYFRLFK
jgi:hypothetical protein